MGTGHQPIRFGCLGWVCRVPYSFTVYRQSAIIIAASTVLYLSCLFILESVMSSEDLTESVRLDGSDHQVNDNHDNASHIRQQPSSANDVVVDDGPVAIATSDPSNNAAVAESSHEQSIPVSRLNAKTYSNMSDGEARNIHNSPQPPNIDVTIGAISNS